MSCWRLLIFDYFLTLLQKSMIESFWWVLWGMVYYIWKLALFLAERLFFADLLFQLFWHFWFFSHNIYVEGLLFSCPWVCRGSLLESSFSDPPVPPGRRYYCCCYCCCCTLLLLYLECIFWKAIFTTLKYLVTHSNLVVVIVIVVHNSTQNLPF